MKKLILVVEDQENELLLLQMAIKTAGFGDRLAVVRDGREAVDYLSGEGKYARRPPPVPRLVLLDLALPKLSGLEVLKWIRRQVRFVDLPIIICSSSNIESDINAAYALGADAYVMKSAYNELVRVMRGIKKYWLEMPHPPPNCPEWLSVVIPPPSPPGQ